MCDCKQKDDLPGTVLIKLNSAYSPLNILCSCFVDTKEINEAQRQTDRQTERERQRQRQRQTDRQTDRQTESDRDRPTDRPTDRQTNTEKDRQTETGRRRDLAVRQLASKVTFFGL